MYLSVKNSLCVQKLAPLYLRAGAKRGDGGLADAIRHEKKTNELVGGKSHIQKGFERLKNLENILRKQKLNNVDKNIINELIEDLKNALEGK